MFYWRKRDAIVNLSSREKNGNRQGQEFIFSVAQPPFKQATLLLPGPPQWDLGRRKERWTFYGQEMQPVAAVLWKSSLLSVLLYGQWPQWISLLVGGRGWAARRLSSRSWLQRTPLLKRQCSSCLPLCPWLRPQVWVQWMNQWTIFLGNNIRGGLHLRAPRQTLMTETAFLNLVSRQPLFTPWPWCLGFQDSMSASPPILPRCVPGLDLIRTEVLLRHAMDTLYNDDVLSKVQFSVADLCLALWAWPYKKCQTKWAQWPVQATVTPRNIPYEIAVAIHIFPK